MAVRWVVFFTSFSWFLLTTSPDDFGQAFEELGFPHTFSFSLTLATRFVPLIVNESQSVYDAQRSRGLEMDRGNPIKRIKNFIPVLIPLIVSVIRRSFELAESLSARGYGVVEKRTKLYEIKMKPSDYLIFLITLIFLIFSIFIYLY
jgi:energy-coupling factor transport system permease protein